MKQAKKFLALVLVFAMLLPYLGRPAAAEETETAGENTAAAEAEPVTEAPATEAETVEGTEDTDASILMLQLGQTQTAVIAEAGTEAWFRFVPETDGGYFFTSHTDDDTYATLYDADKNPLQEDDDGGVDANFQIGFQAVAGETYYFSVRFLNDEAGSFPVVLKESPVASIAVNPVTMVELTGGWWNTGYNPETDTQEKFYHYGWWDDIEYTVTMKNGDTVTGNGVFFRYNGQEYRLEHSDEQRVSNPWTVGNTYPGTVSFGGVSAEISITIAESPVASIAVNPVTMAEFSGGWWDTGYNPETDTEEQYYRYSWEGRMSYTVTMKNGDTVTGTGSSFEYNGQRYSMNWSDNQSVSNPWTVGNTYPGTVSFGGVSADVSITIEESPVASIAVNPVTMVELTGGWWNTDYNPETDTEEEFYRYGWWNYMSYTVTMKNGDTVTGNGVFFRYNGQKYRLEVSDGQRVSNPWTVGNTYPGTVSIGGASAEVSVTIEESPVASIAVNPVTMAELTGGWWDKVYNPETGTEEEFYRYSWWNYMSYTVTMKNGDTVTGNGVFFQYNGQEYELDYTNGQSVSNPWTVGNTYTGTVSLMGASTEVSITIEESPVESISVNPVTMVELTGGWWSTGYNPETGTEEQFYCYGWWNHIEYTVTMKNGDTVTGNGVFFQYNGQEYELDYTNGQSVSNPWTVGNTYTGTVSLMGASTEVSVTIEESPVASIAVNPVTMVELTGGEWNTGYNPETDTEEQYYRYHWWNNMSFTVTMKNGDMVTGTGTAFSYNGQWYSINWSDNQSYLNPWTAGNTYTGTVSVGGASAEVSVTIEESPVASIAVNPVTLTEFTCGWWNTGYDPETDTEEEFYFYSWRDRMSYTVTMKNGDTVTGTGSGFAYNGQWYSINCSDNQSVSNPWTVGNTYTETVSVGGASAEVSVTIEESPLASIAVNPVALMEFTGGRWDTEYNPETDTEEQYYRYGWWDYMSYTVTMTNGDIVTGSGYGFEYNGQWYSMERSDNQSVGNPWTAGNTYPGTVRIQGASAEVSVTIEESPLESVTVEPLHIPENACGYWEEAYDPESGTYEKTYYRYRWWSYMSYTATMKNGDTVTGTGTSFAYDGWNYTIEYEDNQSALNQLLPGNTYAFRVYIGDAETEVLVSIDATVSEAGYDYTVQDGVAVIANCTLQDTVLTIPETLGGYPVAGILSLGDALEYAQKIVVPDSVTMTSGNVFACFYGPLKKVTLGSGISSISLSQYFYCWNLEQIDVSPENPWYTSVDGVVYDKAVTEMIVYPAQKKDTHIIPDSVTNIDTLFHNPEYSLDGNVPSIYEGVSVQTGAGLTDYVTLDGVVYSADMTTIYTCVREKTGTYVMPDTVTEVYRFAFSNSSLEDVSYSPNVTEIVYGAFCFNKSLKTIRIPSNVKSIGDYAFDCSYGLESVYIEDLTAWCTTDFNSNPLRFAGDLYVKDELVTDLQIPEGITKIPDYAFVGCSAKSLTMPDSVTAIGWRAFANAGMETAELSQNLQSIDYNAFEGAKLKSVTLPDSLINLGGAAFADCKDLQSVHIGSGLTEIPYRAFENTGLKSVVIPENILEIGNDAFAYASLQEVVFENDRVRIDDCAFYRCPLKEVNLPEAMTAVGYEVFAGNKAVTISLPDSVTEIQYRSFAFSENLLSVVLPENLQYIDFCAFEDCGKLSHVLYKGTAEQWDALGVESYMLNDAALHCQAAGNEIAVVDTCARIWHYCYICGQWEYIEKLDGGHTMENGICTVCGYTEGAQETEPAVPETKPVEPTEPVPTEPVPTEPVPTEPVPTEPVPTEPVPTEPVPTEPDPTEPDLTEPEPSEPVEPSEPTSVEIPPVATEIPENVEIQTPEDSNIDSEKAEEAANSLISSIGQTGQPADTGIDSNTAVIEQAKENIKDEDGNTVTGDSYQTSLSIRVGSVVVDTEDDSTVVMKITYDVTPYLYAMSSNGGILGSTELHEFDTEVTFHLPVDKNTAAISAKVEHEGKLLGIFPIETDENGSKYVAVKTTSFSQFTVELHYHQYEAVVTAPTCQAQGYTTHTCECGDSYVDTYTEITGHSYGQWVITKAPTFTASGRQQKTCIHCGHTVTQTIMPAVAMVEKWNVSLMDDLVVNFHLLISESIESTAKVRISLTDQTQTYNVKDLEKTEDGLYVLSMELAAAQMNDDIVIMIMNNHQIGCYANYTVRQYADTVLADSSLSGYHAMVKEMLNYGAAAQAYFGYGTDYPANEGISGVGAAEVPGKAAENIRITGELEGIRFYAATLSYRDKIALRLYFAADGSDIGSYSFAADGIAYTPVEKDGYYYIEIPGITPENLDKAVEVVVTGADGSLIVRYSPMNYIVRMNAKGSENLKALMKALYNYHLAAKNLKNA